MNIELSEKEAAILTAISLGQAFYQSASYSDGKPARISVYSAVVRQRVGVDLSSGDGSVNSLNDRGLLFLKFSIDTGYTLEMTPFGTHALLMHSLGVCENLKSNCE